MFSLFATNTKPGLIDTVGDAIRWTFVTGWDVWCSLFAPLPFGDPYIAIFAALMVCYAIHKIAVSDDQIY